MNPKSLVTAAAIAVVANILVMLTLPGLLGGLGMDSLFWMREAVFGPRHGPAASATVVVAIDEETYRRAPFENLPKAMWTPQLATVMDAVLAGGAKVVGFDLILPTSVEVKLRGYDRGFLLSLRKASRDRKVVLGKVQHQQKPISPYAGQSFAVGHQKNIRSVNVFEDDDGVIRRVPLLFRSRDLRAGERVDPSMSLELAARAAGRRPVLDRDGSVALGDYPVPTGPGGAMLINFAGGEGAVPTYSMADLLACAEAGRGDYFRQAFAGKVVLIGAVLDVEDRKLTSKRFITRPDGANPPPRCVLEELPGLNRKDLARDTVPGVYIHANAVNTLLGRDVPGELTAPARIGVGLGLTLVAAVPTLMLSPLAAGAVVLAGMVGWAGAATVSFHNLMVLPLLNPMAAVLLTFGALLGFRFMIADKDKRHLRQAFSMYLPDTVVERLVRSQSPPALGGETRELTALFSDIRGFTAISEGLEPEILVRFLNRYLSVMTDTIEEYGGFVDKYIGDAVVGVFGAPLPDADHARHAVEAALMCQQRLAGAQSEFGLPGNPEVGTRIGINSGEMLVGNIGSSRRFNYTVMGDAANLASRIEGANKKYGSWIMAGERTRELCGDAIAWREIDCVRVVGRTQPVTLFEPVAPAGELSASDSERLAAFGRALDDYYAKRFDAAVEGFARLAPSDPVAMTYLARAQGLLEKPPPATWDGVTDFDSK